MLLIKGRVGEVYIIGANNEKENLEFAHLILQELGKPEALITYVKDRPGHDRRYAIDNTKITTELGWEPKYTFERGIRETIRWYLEHRNWVERLTLSDYLNYYKRCMTG
ncbi:hypothetical protein CE91St41_13470 [Oscillospiraceae bacterium]|nr:hypothetical protein CE91St40_24070 [Oscillospiraceae bacterium]BDF74458.1 hypothetical protein CE91St41_13470 [Oscillospiraceae bacterium]